MDAFFRMASISRWSIDEGRARDYEVCTRYVIFFKDFLNKYENGDLYYS